jgi:hypothetical protein
MPLREELEGGCSAASHRRAPLHGSFRGGAGRTLSLYSRARVKPLDPGAFGALSRMPVMQGRLAAATAATVAASWAIAKILNWRRERKERLGGLSRRSAGLVGGSPPCYIAEHIQRLIKGDAYHPKRSPDGYICLAVSENRYATMAVPLARLSLTSPPLGLSTSQPWAICGRLSFPLLQRPLRESRPADITTTGYDDPRGGHEFRGRVATLLTSHFRRPIDAAHLYCCAGATGVLSVLFFVLCDWGDGVLIPAPYFTGRAAASRAAPVAPRARAPRAHCLLPRRRLRWRPLGPPHRRGPSAVPHGSVFGRSLRTRRRLGHRCVRPRPALRRPAPPAARAPRSRAGPASDPRRAAACCRRRRSTRPWPQRASAAPCRARCCSRTPTTRRGAAMARTRSAAP